MVNIKYNEDEKNSIKSSIKIKVGTYIHKQPLTIFMSTHIIVIFKMKLRIIFDLIKKLINKRNILRNYFVVSTRQYHGLTFN